MKQPIVPPADIVFRIQQCLVFKSKAGRSIAWGFDTLPIVQGPALTTPEYSFRQIHCFYFSCSCRPIPIVPHVAQPRLVFFPGCFFLCSRLYDVSGHARGRAIDLHAAWRQNSAAVIWTKGVSIDRQQNSGMGIVWQNRISKREHTCWSV